LLASGLLLVTGMTTVPTRGLIIHPAPRPPHTTGLGAPFPPMATPTTGTRPTPAPVARRLPAPMRAPAPAPAATAAPAAPAAPAPTPATTPPAPSPAPSRAPTLALSLPPLPVVSLRIGRGITISLGSGSTPLLQLRLLPGPRAQS
jgi:hypothetical protein